MAISTNFPIKLSDITQEIYGTDASGKTLKGAFSKAASDAGIFHSSFVGSKDRLSNFRGYGRSCDFTITVERTSNSGTTYTLSTNNSTLPVTFSQGENSPMFIAIGNDNLCYMTGYSGSTINFKLTRVINGVTTDIDIATGYQCYGITKDLNNNIFIRLRRPENNHFMIKKVTPSNVVSTFYSVTTSPTPFYTHVAVDNNNTLYLWESNRIDKISSDGTFSNFVGNVAPDAYRMLTDSFRNLYVSEPSAARILKITPDGIVTTFFTAPSTRSVGELMIDSQNNIYTICQYQTSQLMYKITPAGSGSMLKDVSNGGEIPFQYHMGVDDIMSTIVHTYADEDTYIEVFTLSTEGVYTKIGSIQDNHDYTYADPQGNIYVPSLPINKLTKYTGSAVVVIKTNVGGSGDSFTIRRDSSSGPIISSNVFRAQLEVGYSIQGESGSVTSYFVTSNNVCTNTVSASSSAITPGVYFNGDYAASVFEGSVTNAGTITIVGGTAVFRAFTQTALYGSFNSSTDATVHGMNKIISVNSPDQTAESTNTAPLSEGTYNFSFTVSGTNGNAYGGINYTFTEASTTARTQETQYYNDPCGTAFTDLWYDSGDGLYYNSSVGGSLYPDGFAYRFVQGYDATDSIWDMYQFTSGEMAYFGDTLSPCSPA